MIAWLLVAAHAADWAWTAELGGEIDQRPNGFVVLGVRNGPFSVELNTTKLAITYGPALERGKVWVTALVEPATAGMFFERWRDGRAAPDLEALASYGGAAGGGQRYLPLGFYVGGEVFTSMWGFVPTESTNTDLLPAAGPWARFDAVFGFWRPWLDVWVRGGLDVRFDVTSPHVHGRLDVNAPWFARPELIVHAGWADGTDDVVRTRLGGNNPYSVPIAGAAWAEFWAEDYVAARAGLELGEQGEVHTWSAHLLSDVAWFDGRTEVGFAAGGRYDHRGRFGELSVGWAPWLPRAGAAVSVWLRAGITWGKGFGPR